MPSRKSKKGGKRKVKNAVEEEEEESTIEDLGLEVLSDAAGDVFSIDNDGYKPQQSDRNSFEFTDNLALMRLSRMLINLQFLSLMIDNPSVQLPLLFRIVNRGPLYYVGRFYSRIIIDFVYGFQLLVGFLNAQLGSLPARPSKISVEQPQAPDVPSAPNAPDTSGITSGGVTHYYARQLHRLLSASDYVVMPPKAAKMGAEVDFLSERNWHSIKQFSHFVLSALFVIMVVFFTLGMWEIKDYSDRKEIREWMREYVADGWWRRGLFNTVLRLGQGCFAMLAFSFGLFAVARGLNVNSLPEDATVGCALAIVTSVLATAWVVGYMALRATEVTFVRYVSQNVSYTSSIILKRVVKAKVNIGLCFMLILYMPALHIFVQSFFPITDWNKNFALPWRAPVNFYVPCYYMAFPPYTEIHRDPAQMCPVNYATSAAQPSRPRGFYRDRAILSCDSYFGVAIFTAGLFFFVFLAASYLWLWQKFINCVTEEFQSCRFMGVLHALIATREDQRRDYRAKFNRVEILLLELVYELRSQARYLWMGLVFVATLPLVVTRGALRLSVAPVSFLLSPFAFFSGRLLAYCCESLTVEGRMRKVRAEARERRLEMDKYKELTAGGGGDDDFIFDVDEGEEEEVVIRPVAVIVTDAIAWFVLTYNPISLGYSVLRLCARKLMYHINHSASIAELKLQIRVVTDALCCVTELKSGLAGMGGAEGEWRKSLSITAKRAAIEMLTERITQELRLARSEFTADHSLAISVFDRVIDTSGLFMLISQYHYHRLGWSIALWFEMTIYAVVAALGNYHADWQSRIQYLLVINVVFGVLTYVVKPYTEDCDRWFDFSGRVMVVGTAAGILFCYANTPLGANDAVVSKMYDPESSLQYITGAGSLVGSTVGLVDVVIAVYMYIYAVYLIHFIGIFHVVARKIRTVTYGLHDHVLDFLTQKLDERTIGAENMYTGLLVVQQWDDIIREQRRYAFLPWPDVRPPDVLPASVKMLEIKWAAMFNLNVNNLRSSLGLSLLHTAMCSADGEVARWLIHLYPDLLNAEDYQHDTPIFVALKECAYLLTKFGKQNEGALEDDTSYKDEEFLSYYPEIEQYREDAADNGEYMADFADKYEFDAIEERHLRENGYIVETKDTDWAQYKPTFRTFRSKLSKFATSEEIEKEKLEKEKFDMDNAQFVDEKDPAKLAEAKKLQARKEKAVLAAEKASLYRKRFPEDDYQDNFESGQMAAWSILGLNVPDVNLFIDPRTVKFRSNEFGDGEPAYVQREVAELSLDERYIVHSYNSTPVDPATILNPKTGLISDAFPLPEDHAALQEMQDWDFIRKKKRMSARSLVTSMADTKAVLGAAGARGGTAVTMAQRAAADRDVRYKMCKFAEIFLSAEILESTKVMRWDVAAYKDLNKMASKEQGSLAQNLAMACNMNPPPGFSRVSEWTMGVSTNVFDELPDEAPDPLTRAAIAAVNSAKQVHSVLSRGRRRPGQGPQGHSLDYNRIGKISHQTDALNDRAIHYLAECLVCCRSRLTLSDCELSVFGRFGWRAIVRALRRSNCTFIMPSVFVGMKEINVTHLDLSRNELDCGDAVLLADVLLYKQSLVLLDLSYNRIGARGLIRMCKAMKGHENIAVMLLHHNRIGPAAGRELGVLLKFNSSLRLLDLSHNRMGELVRFSTLLCRERVHTAARDIFQGLRGNLSVESLDLSYNNLGPKLAEVVPPAIMRHPTLTSLNLSGNHIGSEKGPGLIFALAGEPGGDKKIESKEATEREMMELVKQGIDIVAEMRARQAKAEAAEHDEGGSKGSSKRKKKKATGKGSPGGGGGDDLSVDNDDDGLPRPSPLVNLQMANNQLGTMAGHAAAALCINSKTLTALDLSGNALGYRGGVAFADGLEKCFGLEPREHEKLTLYKLDQQKYEGRDALVKPLIYTNLVHLNVSRNGLGPRGCQGIAFSVSAPNCTITSLDISDNPVGYSIENGGEANKLGLDLRACLSLSRSMTSINLSRTSLLPVEMVPILGGLSRSKCIRKFVITDMALDEPSCLQLANALVHCPSLRHLELINNKLGPKGGLIIMNRVDIWGRLVRYLDLSGNGLGPIGMIPLKEMLRDPHCAFTTMRLAGNDLMDEGAGYFVAGLKSNTTITDLDLSSNCITATSADKLADVGRGIYKDGRKISDCLLRRVVISDNKFGFQGCKALARAFCGSANLEHFEMANTGAGSSTAKIIASAVRDVATHWRVLDLSGNKLGRDGLNGIFWSLRQNRSLRVLLLGDNGAGPLFASDDDVLLGHGVAVQRAIRANVMLRELDLSYNGIDTLGGINIMEAMLENYTIRKLNLRGNVFDDDIHYALSNLFRYNNVLDELDLGENRLGYQCCFAIADGLECNRSIQIFYVDDNNLSAGGNVPLDAFVRCLSMNTSMRVLVMDTNKLGPEWGRALADAIARNNTLERVSLRDNRFDSTAGRLLMNAYRYAPFLVELALSADEIGTELWEQFRREFRRKRADVNPEDTTDETVIEYKTSPILDHYYNLHHNV